MTLYDHLIHTCQRCAEGDIPYEPISIDLSMHSIQIGERLVLSQGILADDIHMTGLIHFDGDPYAEIERLYAQYKRSVPSRHERLNRGYFKALSSDALSMQELESNMRRTEARVRLEGFICLASCAGLIPWYIPRHFFWRGTDPDCIVYRNWIVFKEENLNEQVS